MSGLELVSGHTEAYRWRQGGQEWACRRRLHRRVRRQRALREYDPTCFCGRIAGRLERIVGKEGTSVGSVPLASRARFGILVPLRFSLGILGLDLLLSLALDNVLFLFLSLVLSSFQLLFLDFVLNFRALVFEALLNHDFSVRASSFLLRGVIEDVLSLGRERTRVLLFVFKLFFDLV